MEDILLIHRKSSRNFSESLQDAAIFKTCLRKVLFCTEQELNSYSDFIEKDDQVLRGENALTLLLEILCGLHSPIIGETEVFGQFKNFVESRKQLGDWIFSDHQKWLNFLMTEIKRTRAQHLVGLGSQSYGSLLRKYSKEQSSITVCGSGHLAQEILPWLSQKDALQVLCRDPGKLPSFDEKYKFKNLTVTSYNESILGEAMVIAAPLSDSRILELIGLQNTPTAIYDLRGEENDLASMLASQFPQVTLMGLHQFFAEIEETKKDTQVKLQAIKQDLFNKSVAFMQRTELRPLGWDDLCA
ncbi:MAG: hypothetical protein ACXVCY_11995 [Pseudobdellovibrionaceae bacterium]